MQATDAINRKLGKDAVKFAAAGLTQPWKTRADYFSRHYTTQKLLVHVAKNSILRSQKHH
jgi:Domain of unknown function (DUF4113)